MNQARVWSRVGLSLPWREGTHDLAQPKQSLGFAKARARGVGVGTVALKAPIRLADARHLPRKGKDLHRGHACRHAYRLAADPDLGQVAVGDVRLEDEIARAFH